MKKFLLHFPIYLALVIYCLVGGGFTLHRLWHWFLVPLGFHDVSLAQAIGINIVIGNLLSGLYIISSKSDTETSALEKAFMVNVLLTLLWAISLVEGYIVHLFM